MPRPRRRPPRLLVVAAAGTLAAVPLLTLPTPGAHRPTGTAAHAPATAAPGRVPEPPGWPLLGAGFVALGGAVAVRRRVRA